MDIIERFIKEPKRAEYQEQYETQRWRLAVMGLFLVFGINFVVRFLALDGSLPPGYLINWRVLFALYILSILASIYLIIFPRKFYLYAILTMAWALAYLFAGEASVGSITYLFACAQGFKLGWFRKHTRIKAIILSLVPLGILVFHLRLGVDAFWTVIKRNFDPFILAVAAIVLFLPEIRQALEKQQGKVLELPASCTHKDTEILREILKGEKYTSIESRLGMPEPSFKRHVGQLFREIGVSGQIEFIARYAGWTLVETDAQPDTDEASGNQE